jgi:hypothetical protein
MSRQVTVVFAACTLTSGQFRGDAERHASLRLDERSDHRSGACDRALGPHLRRSEGRSPPLTAPVAPSSLECQCQREHRDHSGDRLADEKAARSYV